MTPSDRPPQKHRSPPSTRLLLASLVTGLHAVLRRPVGAVGGFVTLTAALVGGCLIPRWNFLFLMLALAPLFGGFPFLGLALLDDRPVTPRLLTEGFRRYQTFLSIFWLGYLMMVFLAAPLGIALWLGRHVTDQAIDPWVIGGGIAMSVVLQVAVMHRYLFVFWLAADSPAETTVAELFARSEELVGRRRFATVLETALLAMLLVAGPVGLSALGAHYRASVAAACDVPL